MRKFIRRWLGIEEDPLPRAIALGRGGFYVLESDHELNREEILAFEAYLAPIKKRTGCDFLILDRGIRIVTGEALPHGD